MANSNIEEKIKDYVSKNRNKVFALRNWMSLQMKSFTLMDALKCIYEFAQGRTTVMTDVIEQLTEKRKVQGRSQVYAAQEHGTIDIRKDNSGRLVVTGYNENFQPQLKGQHHGGSSNVINKETGQTKKSLQKKEDTLMDAGAEIREMFPNADKQYIYMVLKAVNEYAAQRKKSLEFILKGMKKGRYYFDDDRNRILPKVHESKVICINEDILSEIEEEYRMDEYKFILNTKRFLAQLLDDAANAQPNDFLKHNGVTRAKLLSLLTQSGVVQKKEKISDKDENGEPKEATMLVSFSIPKEKGKNAMDALNYKLKKIYIRLFERNSFNKKRGIDECDGGAMSGGGEGATSSASSGAFESTPLFGNVVRRKMPSEIDETSTSDAGDYTYDVTFAGDDETLARHNGEGGSVSVNLTEDENEYLVEWSNGINFDEDMVNCIVFDIQSEPDEEEIEEMREEGYTEEEIANSIEYSLECYDSGYETLGYFDGTCEEIEDIFGEDIANEIKSRRNGRIEDILDHKLDNLDIDNVNDVNNMAKRMFPNGGDSTYLLTDGDVIGMPDHVYISRIDGMSKARFVSLGNIRLGSGHYGAMDIMQMPTRQQLSQIKQYVKYNGQNGMEVNFCNYKDGDREPNVLFTKRYDSETIPERIVNDIYYYYQDGIKP